MKRKDFIKKAAIGTMALGAGLSACKPASESNDIDAPNVITKRKIRWKMVTTWPPGFPVLGEGCDMFADWVREMSDGRLDIKVYGGGELVPALQAFDVVSSGQAEIGNGVGYYWAGKTSASQFFAALPFGFNAQQMNSWLYCGGGSELHREVYGAFNLVPFPSGNTGVQMAGWFNKEINSVADFQGLKMRIPGLGGRVMEKMGASAVLTAGGEIYTSLERGVIDATEWIGPYHDYIMGFHKIAKYYYTPGWHEPGPTLETFINKREYEKLPKDLQLIVETAIHRQNIWTLSQFEAKNGEYLEKIKAESDVGLRQFSPEIMAALREKTAEVIDTLANENPLNKKIYASIENFKKKTGQWSAVSEKLYYQGLG